MISVSQALELAGWRRTVAELYATVRDSAEPEHAHEIWRRGRDDLFQRHPQSPLAAEDPLRGTGLPYFPYDPAMRFEAEVDPVAESVRRNVETTDGTVPFDLVGRVAVADLDIVLDVWW